MTERETTMNPTTATIVPLDIFSWVQGLTSSTIDTLNGVVLAAAVIFILIRAIMSKLSAAVIISTILVAGLLIAGISNLQSISDMLGISLPS